MRNRIGFALLAVGIALVATQLAALEENDSSTASKSSRKAADHAADEAMIRANIDAFVTGFNAKKAKDVARLFSEFAQIVTEDDETVEGRAEIEKRFVEIFADEPQSRMEVVVDSLRFLGSELAVEVGSTKEVSSEGETPEYGRYTVLHVKRDGKWLMALVKDTAGTPPGNHDRLRPLAWLTGEWIDDGGSTVVHTNCGWSEDKNFLIQRMTVQISGKDAMQITQRIGWDPLNKRIRSWAFDTEGGFSEGMWARDGDSWVIKSTGVRSDGAPASATNVLVPTGTDGYVWRVRDRVVGDDVEPPLEVKVVRKPPEPAK